MSTWQIDPHKSTNDNLWDAIDKSARAILTKRKLYITQAEYHDLLMDIEVASRSAFLRMLREGRYNSKYTFYQNVYGRVWSKSGHIIDSHLQQIRKRLDMEQLDDHELQTKLPTYISTSEYERRKNPPKGNTIAAEHNKQQRDYDEYCDCCYEYNITPMSLEDYLGQD